MQQPAALPQLGTEDKKLEPEQSLDRRIEGNAAPEQALSTDVAVVDPQSCAKWSFRGFLRYCGVALDPGNLEADIQLGQGAGYKLLWFTAISNLCFGFCFQVLSGKLGLVTGTDLARHVGQQWPKPARILLWILIETSILAADIQETVGCALAISILSQGRIPLWGGCLLVSAMAFALLYLDRIGFRYVEAAYGVLIAVEGLAMGINCFRTQPPAAEVVKGVFIPRLDASSVVLAVGALGALVMPYNIFFQSHVVNGRPRDVATDDKKRVTLWYMRVESFLMLAIAFVINLFVVVVFATTYSNDSDTAPGLGLATAGAYLGDTFGASYKYMWAVGLLASGQVATMCLVYAGQVVMVGLLDLQVSSGTRLLGTRCIGLVPVLVLAVIFESTGTFDMVAQSLNIVQSVLLPFGLIPVIHMTASIDTMGPKFANAHWVTIFAAIIVLIVLGVNGYTLLTIPENPPTTSGNPLPQTPGVKAGFACLVVFYYSLAGYFAVGPTRWPQLLKTLKKRCHATLLWLKTNRRFADIESMLEVHF